MVLWMQALGERKGDLENTTRWQRPRTSDYVIPSRGLDRLCSEFMTMTSVLVCCTPPFSYHDDVRPRSGPA